VLPIGDILQEIQDPDPGDSKQDIPVHVLSLSFINYYGFGDQMLRCSGFGAMLATCCHSPYLSNDDLLNDVLGNNIFQARGEASERATSVLYLFQFNHAINQKQQPAKEGMHLNLRPCREM
jgi:hypothetical protein